VKTPYAASVLPVQDIVEQVVSLAGHEVRVLRPRDSEALLDEEAFERDEFLPYWADIWPSALELAEHVAERPMPGARVLELGTGLGLPAIAAALGGAEVLATDWSRDALAFCAENARRNGATVRTARWDWGRPAPDETAGSDLENSRFDLVLAADVLYEQRNVDQLLALLPALVDDGEVWLTDPQRLPAMRFLREAAGRFTVETRASEHRARVQLHVMRVRGRG
jgi:predicted nicotinamide N-methyase